MIRATTPVRIPPTALVAAAGLHLLIGAAALASWQVVPPIDEAVPIEVDLAVLAAPPAEPQPAPAAAQPESAEPEPAESQPLAFDPSVIPEPEPPPPLVFEKPKAPPPKAAPPPPRPAARPAPAVASAPIAPSVPAPAAAAPSAPAHDSSYLDRLAAAIERERDYPLHSRRQGHQGRVALHLVIAASGRLLDSHVAVSSGIEALDRAALGMVRRAILPPLLPALGAESAIFTVPIVFALR